MVFDPKITLKKWAYELIILVIITGLTYLAEVILPELQISFPQYAGIIIIFVPIIVGLINWLKHKDDPVTP